MEKLTHILIGLFLTCFVGINVYGMSPALLSSFSGKTPGGSGTTCAIFESRITGDDTTYECHRYNGHQYIGVLFSDTTQANTLCQVDWYINTSPGSPSVNDYYTEVWSLTGDNLNTVVANGRSEKVDGNNAWSAEFVTFAFSTPPTLSQSTTYAITLKSIDNDDAADTAGEYDSDNYISFRYDNDNGGGTYVKHRYQWNAAKTSTQKYTNDDILLKVYTNQ